MLTHTDTHDYSDDTAAEKALRSHLMSRDAGSIGAPTSQLEARLRTGMRLLTAEGRNEMLAGQFAAYPLDSESLMAGGR